MYRHYSNIYSHFKCYFALEDFNDTCKGYIYTVLLASSCTKLYNIINKKEDKNEKKIV